MLKASHAFVTGCREINLVLIEIPSPLVKRHRIKKCCRAAGGEILSLVLPSNESHKLQK